MKLRVFHCKLQKAVYYQKYGNIQCKLLEPVHDQNLEPGM